MSPFSHYEEFKAALESLFDPSYSLVKTLSIWFVKLRPFVLNSLQAHTGQIRFLLTVFARSESFSNFCPKKWPQIGQLASKGKLLHECQFEKITSQYCTGQKIHWMVSSLQEKSSQSIKRKSFFTSRLWFWNSRPLPWGIIDPRHGTVCREANHFFRSDKEREKHTTWFLIISNRFSK